MLAIPRLLAPVLLAGLAAAQAPDAHARGRARFVDLGCAHCHAASPDLTRQSPRGPDLGRIGARLTEPWMARWLQNPSAAHPQARMPALFPSDDEGRQQARDAAAFLARRGGPLSRARVDHDRDERGERLFVVRGCVACHRLPGEPDDDRFLLRDLAAKTGPVQLARYLEQPLRHHPRGLMPDLQLSRRDAEALAGWLVAETPDGDGEASSQGDPVRGAELVATKRCSACHDGIAAGDAPGDAPPAPALDDLRGASGGCLAPQPESGLPRYAWRAGDREALFAFLRDPARPESAADQLDRRLAQLRCLACHQRDGRGGMPPAVLEPFHAATGADTADHTDPPALTAVEQKLRPEWVEAVLRGRERVRPYMKIRMPHYAPELTAGLAPLLAGPEVAETPAEADLEDVEHGRALVGFTGFACVICHDFAGRPANGSRAPDLATAYRRLRPEFLERWILAPSAVTPGTRMPTFFQGEQSTAPHILGGDTKAQIRALLAYLRQGERATPPTGMEPAADAVVKVGDRPIVQRTRLPRVDPRSLAIGFPGGLSLVLDLAEPRLGYVWQGGFLDLQRKWTGRGDGPCDLIGGVLMDGAPGPMFGRGNIRFDAQLAGYRLEGETVVVRFRVEDAPVELALDLARSDAALGLRVRISSQWGEPLEVALGQRAAEGQERGGDGHLVRLRAEDGALCYLRTAQPSPGSAAGVLVPAGGEAEGILWFPVSASPAALEGMAEWQR